MVSSFTGEDAARPNGDHCRRVPEQIEISVTGAGRTAGHQSDYV